MSYPPGQAATMAKHRQSPDDQSPPGPPEPPRFQEPSPIPSPSPSPGPSPSPTRPLAAGGATPAATAPPRIPDSSPSARKALELPALAKASEEGLQEAAEAVFRGAGEALNGVFAYETAEGEPTDDIWIPTDSEAEGVAKPAGRLIARRLPDVPGGDASDTADLVSALIPLGVWAVRGLAETIPRIMRARKEAAATLQQTAPQDGPRDV